MMDMLIIGGTVFLGRALVEAARQRGHHVTLFNRGQSNPGVYPDIEQIHGDRKVDLSPLDGRRWDAVIDPSGYAPRVVRMSASRLADAADHYTFISSLSVYASPSQAGIDESGPVAKLEDETVEEITGDTYGPLKALCELEAERAMPGRALILRPGLIVGPYDPTDRFTYWPHRVARGGEVLAPGHPGKVVQFIDVRDLAEWTLRMIEAGKTGVYNATGMDYALTMEQTLQACKQVSVSDAIFTWVSDEFLLAHKVEPWIGLPLWIPDSAPDSAGFYAFNCSKAIADGLAFRPLADTVGATLAWEATRPPDHSWRAGITRQREAELLDAWKGEVSDTIL